jgi:hypothetical protein
MSESHFRPTAIITQMRTSRNDMGGVQAATEPRATVVSQFYLECSTGIREATKSAKVPRFS